MALIPLQIKSIFEGLMPTGMVGKEGQFLAAIGIDPDQPLTDTTGDTRASASIRPVSYQPFSGQNVDSYPIAILTNPKNTYVYSFLRNGKIVRYDQNLANETLIGNVLANRIEGAWYYNNYFYITTPTTVAHYGPLDGTPILTENVWSGTTLGSQTAIVDNPYPKTILGIEYLKHFGISHLDNNSYFLDYISGIGKVHKIATTKTTYEGDTNNGSSYAILNLPTNYIPLTIVSYGNDMVVAAAYSINDTIVQGRAALFFFNPADTTPSFYKKLQLPDTLCTVLEYVDGVLYGLSGDPHGGYRLWQYVGGDTVQTVTIVEQGHLPLQGAGDSIGTKISWGADITDPMNASGVMSYGSKSDLLPRGLHFIANANYT